MEIKIIQIHCTLLNSFYIDKHETNYFYAITCGYICNFSYILGILVSACNDIIATCIADVID